MDGLGWAWRVCSCRFTWFGDVGGVIFFFVVFEDEDRVREEVDGEGEV